MPGLTAIDGDRSYQWGPSDTDVPHLFVASGTYEAPFGIRVGGILFARSGFPYTGVVGLDADGDGFTGNAPGNALSSSYGDRPASLSRNSFRLPSNVTLDTSVAYDLKLVGAQRLEIRLDAFNLLNRKNISGAEQHHRPQPRSAPGELRHDHAVRDQRQAQIALRYRF